MGISKPIDRLPRLSRLRGFIL